MTRFYLLAGIAAAALFTSGSMVVSNNRSNKIDEFKSKLSDLAFCRTAFEIASSHPSYASRFVSTKEAKEKLIAESNTFDAKRLQIESLISEHLESANDLPLDPKKRLELIEKVIWDADLQAVQETGWVEEPEKFLDRIDEICQSYIK